MQFDKYNIFRGIEDVILYGAIISQECAPPEFEETLPESIQEIAVWQISNDTAESSLTYQNISSGFMAELPFESRLSISGRKLTGLDYTARVYDKEEDRKRKNMSFFKMEQELWMRVSGNIGDRLNIDVDYNDASGKKDISLIYKGQHGEFIQEAAFGDISVSFPNAEFTGYSKELFGLKVNTRYKNLELNAFFSETKSMSEIKRFTGNMQLERRIIADTSYVKLKYYSLLRNNETRTIKNGTVEVYADYQKLDPTYNISIPADTVLYDLNGTGVSCIGNFVHLVAGQDYTVDYNTGMLIFKNTLTSNCIIAVNCEFEDGSALGNNPLIIKDMDNIVAVTTELKTFYDLGNLGIIRDNGRGNFLLEIKDLNGNAPSTIEGGKDMPVYPPKTGYRANIAVDFGNDVFNLAQPLHDNLYLKGTSRYKFIAEINMRLRHLYCVPALLRILKKLLLTE
ncbi:MAG: hypothetical protein LBN19_00100 [Endomicrobium sp.]|nr:hypothetical protein [Endomicrobium sp.]